MLCQNCGKANAVAHITEVINGQKTEKHLCAECAQKLGYTQPGFMHFNFGDLLGSMLGVPVQHRRVEENTQRCPFCGMTLEEFIRTGRAGCATCYSTFYDNLIGSIGRIHGKTAHTGKVPRIAGASLQRERELERLKKQLQEAVDAQEYERAATLRDEIRAKEDNAQQEGN